jgi:peptidoglycan hydrolase CwlO-like protein
MATAKKDPITVYLESRKALQSRKRALQVQYNKVDDQISKLSGERDVLDDQIDELDRVLYGDADD